MVNTAYILMPIWVILAISIPSIIIVLVYKLGIIPGKLKNKMPKESIEEYNNLKEQISCLKSTNETLKSLTEEFDANDYESKIDLFQNIVKNIPNLSDAQNNEERFNIINDFLCNYIYIKEINEQKSIAYSKFSSQLKEYIDTYWKIIGLRNKCYEVSSSFDRQGEPPLSEEQYRKNIEMLLNIASDSYNTMTNKPRSEENKDKLNALINTIVNQ